MAPSHGYGQSIVGINNMKNIFTTIIEVITLAFILDLLILMATIWQISNGQETQHIPFWDAQIKVFINLIN